MTNGISRPEIRSLSGADFDQWKPLWQDYLAFYESSMADEDSRITFQRLLDPTETMGGLLAFTGSRAIGLAHWIRHRSTWTAADHIYLNDLYTASDARGEGVGRALIERVCDVGRTLGAARVHWLTHETNKRAMRLYDQVAVRPGFVQYMKAL